MRKLSVRLQSFFVNLFLVAIVVSIGAVCFFPGVESASSGGKAIYEGKSKKGASIMINVYWGEDIVKEMLAVLDEYAATATFFIGGCWADDHAELVKEIADHGQEIASHGYFHKSHGKMSYEENYKEIKASVDFLSRASGKKITLFAPPSGEYNKGTLSACEALGLKTIMWSKDTVDWRDKDEELVFTRATKNVEGGDLILMHPMEHTLKALPRILEEWSRKGLTAISVSENIGEII